MTVESPIASNRRVPPPAVPRRVRGVELFVGNADAKPLTRRGIGLGVLAVLVATVVSLARTRGPGALNTIWAEDGQDFLADALNKSVLDAVGAPFNGYWHIGPRLLAEVASRFPVEWAPGVLSTEAALVTSVLAVVVYLAGGAYLGHPALRLLAAVPVALPWAGIGWVENNVATLQFPLLYGLFWALLWVPGTRWGRLAAIGVVLLTGFSTALAIIFVPLALARLVIRRDRLTAALVVALGAGMALQFGGLALGWTARAVGTPRYDPVWAVGDYLTKLVPTAIFGEKWTFDTMRQGVCPQFVVGHTGEHRLLVATAWAILAAVVVLGVRRCRPSWTLAAVAAAHSVLLYSISIMTLGCAANRYFVGPALLLLTAVAAMLRPRPSPPPATPSAGISATTTSAPAGSVDGPGRLTTATVALLTLATVVCIADLRSDSPRSTLSPRWTDLVKTARRECADQHPTTVRIVTTRPNWIMVIRCAALQ